MLCESCREVSRALTPVQSHSEGHVFLLCELCQTRLREQRLMPIQWLNLACMHTYHVFELHDDFYTLFGRSDCEEGDPWEVRDFRESVDRRVDVLIAWNGELGDAEGRELVGYLRKFESADVIGVLTERMQTSPYRAVHSALTNVLQYQIVDKKATALLSRQWALDRPIVDLYDWVVLSRTCLPWTVVRDRFFEVVKAEHPNSRRFELGTLSKLVEGQPDPVRAKTVLEFLQLTPAFEAVQLLGMDCTLLAAQDRVVVADVLLGDAAWTSVAESEELSLPKATPDSFDRTFSAYWAWGQVAAASGDVEWTKRVFGETRRWWRTVSAAAVVGQGRQQDRVFPAVARAVENNANKLREWSTLELDLKSSGLWVEP